MLLIAYLLKLKKVFERKGDEKKVGINRPELAAKKISKMIKLNKPLVVFDLETTGLAISKDKIIQIAYVKIWGNGRIKKGDILLNPEMKISKESTAVCGIKNEDLLDKPKFRDIAQELWETFNNCHYGGYNIINFDLPVLRREFIRVGMDFDYTKANVIDPKIIYHYMEPPTLAAAYKRYCHKELIATGDIWSDIGATFNILEKQLEEYEEIRDWDFVNKINLDDRDIMYLDARRKIYWRNGEAFFAFSKYKNVPITEVARIDPEFLKWILKSDFSERIKILTKKALKEVYIDGKSRQNKRVLTKKA